MNITRNDTGVSPEVNEKREQLIPILQEVQEKNGYISRESIVEIAKRLSIPASKVFGVATFYNQFKLNAPGKYQIQICRGTACHVKGSKVILEALVNELKIKPGETTKDGLFSIETVACIGACGLAPVIAVNGKYYSKVTPDSIIKILNSYRNEEKKNG
jgi:NADH-quinone oxidoreductase E subunit